jgi:hypothetical protein
MATLPADSAALTISNFDSSLRTGAAACSLKTLKFVDAYGLVGTVCAVRQALAEDNDLTLELPSNPGIQAHLAAMGFDDFLRQIGEPGLPAGGVKAEASGVVVPLRSAADAGGEQVISQLLWDQLSDQVSPQILAAIGEGVWEMVANALEHSGSDASVMAQVYRIDRGGRPPDHDDRVQVVIGDIGRGIRGSFASSPDHDPDNDLQAIDLALQYLISSVHEDPGRGQGLSTTLEQVVDLGGRMIVRSGCGRVSIEGDQRDEETVAPLGGTMVALSLPLYPG